jgi:hypothetical protein
VYVANSLKCAAAYQLAIVTFVKIAFRPKYQSFSLKPYNMHISHQISEVFTWLQRVKLVIFESIDHLYLECSRDFSGSFILILTITSSSGVLNQCRAQCFMRVFKFSGSVCTLLLKVIVIGQVRQMMLSHPHWKADSSVHAEKPMVAVQQDNASGESDESVGHCEWWQRKCVERSCRWQ